jgi:glycosyltransferase involved in cell wall biosynthesis
MSTPRRPKIAVVTWSVNHNPVGRAHVLAELLAHEFDVEIIGFDFPAHGRGVWAPVRDGRIPIKSYAGAAFPEQFDLMRAVGTGLAADAVLVSKPRLPSIAVGAFAKEARQCALVIDVDDWELSFVGAHEAVDVHDAAAIRRDDTALSPYGRVWTQVCEPLIAEADQRTVSNIALRERFGGSIVPHARDEALFDPARYDREMVRARFGISPDVRLLLFGGTPRRHKGLIDLAKAIVEIDDPSLVLGVIATAELRELRSDLKRIGCPVVELPPQPFDDMPALLAAADLTAVLQDPGSQISRYQMPAKVTDALAMQVPCIVNAVPPLQPLIDGGHLEVVDQDGLASTLRRVLGDYSAAKDRARANRGVFLNQYSHASVAPVLAGVMRAAMEAPAPLRSGLRTLLSLQRDMFDRQLRGGGAQSSSASVRSEGEPKRTPRWPRDIPRRRRTDTYDLVVFWKQNDTGIYGRRADLLVAEMAKAPNVGRTVQFDAPLGIEALRRAGQSGAADQDQMIFETTVRRILGQEDDATFIRHTFLFDDRGERLDLPRRDQFGDFVDEVLRKHGIGRRNVVFWLYPTNPDLPALIDRFTPDVVVSDVVDDNRTWYPVGSNQYLQLTENYQAVLGRSDVVFANCASVRDGMSEYHDAVELLPNACEPSDVLADSPCDIPDELAKIDGPIIGYVGNLSSRIDVDLIEYVATSRPDWTIVLIGSTHAGQDVLRAARHRNVKILGPRHYEEAKRFIKAFDVAIVPHINNVMTRSMNPLKVFVYCALGVPVVSTELANLDELRDMITTAADPVDFVLAIEAAVGRGRQSLTETQLRLLQENSWSVRAERAQKLVDAALAQRVGATSPGWRA